MRVSVNTNLGSFEVELYEDKAPKTVKNFLNYVEQNFYDGTIFHRVIENFMIQGGGFTEDMDQKETNAKIENEADNGLSNVRGSIAMARTQDPHSATAQFFVNVKDNSFLDHTAKNPAGWGYCVFGQVSSGMDVVDKIKGVETGNYSYFQDVPTSAVVIESITKL